MDWTLTIDPKGKKMTVKDRIYTGIDVSALASWTSLYFLGYIGLAHLVVMAIIIAMAILVWTGVISFTLKQADDHAKDN